MPELLKSYLDEIVTAASAIDPNELAAVGEVLLSAWRSGATVYTVGNGGSASLAGHMAADFAKNTATDLGRGPDAAARKRLNVVSLGENTAMITALGNDIAFEDIYVEQLKMGLRAGDVVLGISGSGSSPNVVRAFQFARLAGATVVAFTSSRPTAVAMTSLADVSLVAQTTVMEQIEDIHTIANHALATWLREKIATELGAG